MDDEVVLARDLARLDALWLVGLRLTAHLPHGRAAGCTEWQAVWCLVHGDCKCDDGAWPLVHNNPACVLHGHRLGDSEYGFY